MSFATPLALLATRSCRCCSVATCGNCAASGRAPFATPASLSSARRSRGDRVGVVTFPLRCSSPPSPRWPSRPRDRGSPRTLLSTRPRSSSRSMCRARCAPPTCRRTVSPPHRTPPRSSSRTRWPERASGSSPSPTSPSWSCRRLATRRRFTSAIDGLTTGRGTVIGAATLQAIDAIASVDPNVAPVDATSRLRPTRARQRPAPATTTARHDSRTSAAQGYVPDIVVLLTDGANTRGITPVDAAKQAAARRVRVYTIGFGTDNPTALVCTAAQLGAGVFDGGGGNGGRGNGRRWRWAAQLLRPRRNHVEGRRCGNRRKVLPGRGRPPTARRVRQAAVATSRTSTRNTRSACGSSMIGGGAGGCGVHHVVAVDYEHDVHGLTPAPRRVPAPARHHPAGAPQHDGHGEQPQAPGDVADEVGEAGPEPERDEHAGGDQRGGRVAEVRRSSAGRWRG